MNVNELSGRLVGAAGHQKVLVHVVFEHEGTHFAGLLEIRGAFEDYAKDQFLITTNMGSITQFLGKKEAP